jgi:uncharacterized protein (DUF433 family)
MLNWSECPAVEQRPEIMGGARVFKGTRVPVDALFENLDSGATAQQFVEWFPTVQLDQVHSVLAFTRQRPVGRA